MTRRIASSALCAALAVVALVPACSGGILGNRGGDTRCGDFLSQDEQAQRETIRAYLSESGEDPVNLQIDTTRVVVIGFCRTLGRDDDPIRRIEG
ncbi:hypothetical protein [Hoyosella subflava]|uniref:Lipoprotein n=1 Tax=Hoyosella subflava (strain DSM 45089 / JCM 17490 / NBRC 109087 / DQS3-9A1) TaxID=443218 RepID=F6ELH5_HOYSD|nr:hypothetical protein [Hoyosella subflava]AEF40225.1 hypothetical protein AS9A_1776 [Hoyosella subflava DQS3-9A1]